MSVPGRGFGSDSIPRGKATRPPGTQTIDTTLQSLAGGESEESVRTERRETVYGGCDVPMTAIHSDISAQVPRERNPVISRGCR
jgi:hypothetical protein